MQVGRVSPRAPHMAVVAAAKFLALGKNGAKPHTSEGGELQEGGGEESLSVTKTKEDDSLPSDEDEGNETMTTSDDDEEEGADADADEEEDDEEGGLGRVTVIESIPPHRLVSSAWHLASSIYSHPRVDVDHTSRRKNKNKNNYNNKRERERGGGGGGENKYHWNQWY